VVCFAESLSPAGRGEDILMLLQNLGQFHGRTSFRWNGEEKTRGRKVFFRAMERAIRSERHFWATMNYVHNNAVHHGYVKLWTEWPWSSAAAFLEKFGRSEAERIWRAYPLRQFGAKWDAREI
jgi:putative transposase